jgi:hypothetical protein
MRLAPRAFRSDMVVSMKRRSSKKRRWHPHDHFVQVCLSAPDIARLLIRRACPAAVAHAVNWTTLRLEPTVFKSVDTSVPSEIRTDLVVSANWIDCAHRVYFQVEHFSVGRMPSSARLMSNREALRRHLLLKGESDGDVPFIFQILLMQGLNPVKIPRAKLSPAARSALGALANGSTTEPLVQVIDVPAMDDATLHAAEPDACFLLILKAVRLVTVIEHLPAILQQVKGLDPFARSTQLRDEVLAYLPLGVPEFDKARYYQIIDASFPPNKAPAMRTLAQSWIDEGYAEGLEKGLEQGLEQGLEKGLEKGLEQGLEQGLEKGLEKGLEQGRELGRQLGRQEGLLDTKRETLQLILHKRFGALSAQHLAAIDRASLDQLNALIEAALDADSIDQVLADQ